MKKARSTVKNIRTSYKLHKAKGFTTLDVNEYAKVANAYNKFITNLVLEGHEVKLPSKLGAVSIKGIYKPLSLDEDGKIKGSIDYKTTNELWERCPECKERKQKVYHSNEHTNGIMYKFLWSKKNMILENKIFYEMIFVRTTKRIMADLVINKGKEYYVEPIKI